MVATPLVDIIAVGLDNGEILIVNIRKCAILFRMKQKRTVTALAFSQSEPYMASADESGNILLWDLENRKIIYRMEAALSHEIDHLVFIPNIALLLAGSSQGNTLKQLRINREDAKTLTLFRERCGSSSPINFVKCQNSKEITYSTQQSVHFSSIYSHSNNYSLPIRSYYLDSRLPYFLISNHFNVEIYKERTLFCKVNIHEVAEFGAISASHKYAVVASSKRLLKIAIA